MLIFVTNYIIYKNYIVQARVIVIIFLIVELRIK